MLLVVFVLIFLSGTSAKKVLLRLTNDSKTNRFDDALKNMQPRRLMLNHWILHSEQNTKAENNGWEVYMSISLPTISSIASPSYTPTKSPEATSLAPAYTLINDTISAPPHSSSNSPTISYNYPNNTTVVPSPTPHASRTEIPSLTQYPTYRNASTSGSPSTNRIPTYPATTAPLTPERGNDTTSAPTQTIIPSTEDFSHPSSTPTSTMIADTIFACKSDNVVGLSMQSLPLSTQLSFKLGYSVESSFNESEYIDKIERQILVTAVAGALQCENAGVFTTDVIPELMGRSNKLDVTMNTTRTNETCLASPISQCKIFETEFQVIVNDDMDAKVGEFLGYLLIREKMDDGTFVETVPNVNRCEYLRPLPLIAPVSNGGGSNQQTNQDKSERLSVSPWSLATLSLLSEYF
jgi:hypothetical protein